MKPTAIDNLREEISNLIPCLDSWCDKNGTTTNGSAEEPEPAQCQYCYEIRFPAIDQLEALFTRYATRQADEARLEELGSLLADGSMDTDLEAVKYHIKERRIATIKARLDNPIEEG